MAAGSEDDLICDFAETYHILDWRALPLPLAATLAAGLPDSSRIKRRLAGLQAPLETVLLAKLVDQMATWLWWHSKDGERGRNQPESIAEKLTQPEQPKQKLRVFRSGDEFMQFYKKMTGEV
jgi:hypothetical protein